MSVQALNDLAQGCFDAWADLGCLQEHVSDDIAQGCVEVGADFGQCSLKSF